MNDRKNHTCNHCLVIDVKERAFYSFPSRKAWNMSYA